MKQPSPEMLALRQEGVDLLCEFEDSSLLEQVVALIRQSYMDEIVEYGADGQAITRAELFASFRKGIDEVASGGGISGAEMSKINRNFIS
jgi:hypothetical protein